MITENELAKLTPKDWLLLRLEFFTLHRGAKKSNVCSPGHIVKDYNKAKSTRAVPYGTLVWYYEKALLQLSAHTVLPEQMCTEKVEFQIKSVSLKCYSWPLTQALLYYALTDELEFVYWEVDPGHTSSLSNLNTRFPYTMELEFKSFLQYAVPALLLKKKEGRLV